MLPLFFQCTDHGGNGRGAPKRAGENTDYGDYNLLILEHLAATHTAQGAGPIQLKELVPRWQQRLLTWRAWMCTQTKKTSDQVMRGMALSKIGGFSNAMAVRHAAAYAYFDQEDQVVEAALTSMFTHREQTALDGGAFFAKVTYRVLHKNLSPRQAIESVAAEASSSAFIRQKVAQALQKVDEALDGSTSLSQEEYVDDLSLTSMARLWDVGKTEPIKVGKASPTEGTLPGSIYFIVKYATLEQEGKIDNAYAAAASANAEVGGDNASRGVVIGMVLGAWSGVGAIPQAWKETYVEWERCEALLSNAPLLLASSNEEL